jgi:CRISPR/Cas system-associated endonuclease/helicase Cas3
MLIIEHAKSQNRHKGDGNYYERHHILPKSLFPLWKSRKLNIVLLTAREHFFCHQLLAKIYPGKEMAFALHLLLTTNNGKLMISSREYEKIQKLNSIYRKQMKPNLGRHWTEEQRKHISEGTKRGMMLMSDEDKTSCKIKNAEVNRLMGLGRRKPKLPKPKLSKDEWMERHYDSWKNRRRKVLCVETGEVFESVKAAKEKYGKTCKIDRAAREGRTSMGFHWKYVN